MAKSLRSKFKRKMRAIARTKKAPKEHKLLEGAVARREVFEALEASKAAEELPEDKAEGDDEQMDTSKKSTLNLKTMKLGDGTYPKWLNPGKIKRMKKKATQAKQSKAKKTRGRR